MKALTLIILTFSIDVFSHATPIIVNRRQLQMNLSSTHNHTQQQINETKLSGNNCYYNMNVKTSCSSPAHTTDVIGISVGDADGNEVLFCTIPPGINHKINIWMIHAKLDGPYSGMFKRCTTVAFTLVGPCLGKICKMYLARVGSDGWMPETVTAYDPDDNSPITFKFNYFIPQAQNSGFDYCHNKL